MKILYHHRIVSRDGQAVHIDEIIKAFRHLGHEVVVVCPPSFEAAGAAMGGDSPLVGWLKRHIPSALYELLELGYSLRAYLRLRQAWRRHRPDVLYERYNSFLLAGRWLARQTGLPFLSEVNAPLTDERKAHGSLALDGLARACDRRVWRAADYVLPVTDVLADYIRAEGVPDSRIRVIANGVDADIFHPALDGSTARAALGLSAQTLLLGFVGFFRPWHGLDRVVGALPRLPHAHLLVVGDGENRAELEAQAAELGVADRLTLTGFVNRDRIAPYVAAFDIALQPAVVAYASPLKLFEYMALGKAIVAPDQRNIREVLSDGEDAVLVPPDDPQAFADAVEALAGESDRRARLGAAAAAKIRDEGRTWLGNAETILALFEDLLARRR